MTVSRGCTSRSDRGREMRQIARINAKKKFCTNDVIPAYENYYKRVLDVESNLFP